MKRYSLKVIGLQPEGVDAVTIIFKQPGLKKITYLPGQYLTLILRINGRRYVRPYSFSSAPTIDATLNITVKRMHGGVVSNHILDKLKVGDLVEAIEPLGSFTLPNDAELFGKHIILWGSGSGITPLMSIAKHALHYRHASHVTLVYGNRSRETTIFADQIEQLQQQHPDIFSVWHFHTRAAADVSNPYMIQGRISPEKVLAVINKEGDLINTLHYICGPAGLKESVKSVIQKCGVAADAIFSEDFEVVRDPKDFEDIITQNISVTNENITTEVEVAKGKSILEAGLDAGLELAYSCQTGDCLLCRAQLISGNVKMIGIKKADMLADDECLLCCSFPLTNNIKLITK